MEALEKTDLTYLRASKRQEKLLKQAEEAEITLREPRLLDIFTRLPGMKHCVAAVRRLRDTLNPDRGLLQVQRRLLRQAVLLRGGMPIHHVAGVLQKEGFAVSVVENSGFNADNLGESFAEDAQTRSSEPKNTARGYAKQSYHAEQIAMIIEKIAKRSGAPLAWGCESLAAAIGNLLELRKRRRVMLAGPKASAVMISLLPLLALSMGDFLGFDPWRVLGQGGGRIVLILGLLLLLCGALWMRAQIKNTQQAEKLAGFESELVVLALRGGMPVEHALREVADAVSAADTDWLGCDELSRDSAAVKAIQLAQRSGSANTQTLLETAIVARRESAEKVEQSAEKLGTKV
ncbi:MAG: hypothetical protein Q4C71_05400, partial [Microbacteriaceae bacterium]|nr:hypothetical protein [Microbacteriaceae bacterium]